MPVVGRWLSKEISPPFSTIITFRATLIMAKITYQQVYEKSRDDAKWKELQERIQGYHKECSEYKQKQRQAFRKIIQFDKLEDLAMDRMGNCEGNDHDEALLDCTGQDQETWFWSWSGAEDLCFDGMVEAAIAASNAQSMIEVVKDKIKVTVALQNNRESEIRAKLEAEASDK
jgi:hypothetical protein